MLRAPGNGTELKSRAEGSDKEETYRLPNDNMFTPAVRVVKEKLCPTALDVVTELLVATIPTALSTVLTTTYGALPTSFGAASFRRVKTQYDFVISTDSAGGSAGRSWSMDAPMTMQRQVLTV